MNPLHRRSVLLISCRDEKGLIHKITGALFRNGLNINENAEHVEHFTQTFFMRTELEGAVQASSLLQELKAALPGGASIELREAKVKKLLVFGTRETHCVGDLLLRHASGELGAQIQAVVSQYDDLKKLTERFELPYHSVSTSGLTREQHEEQLIKVIGHYNPDFIVLAKYMRILNQSFVEKFPNRILNIHHSFLPAFIGKNPYLQAYERGVKIIGATAHFVNEELDEGPIITQSVIPVNHTQDAQALARAGRDVERVVLAKALNCILEDRVIVHGRRTLVFE
jgi:formyltetrahydrofolate deformylase